MHRGQLPSLSHLDRMTDSTGMIQHGIYSLPRRESGYTTDDNARALRLCTRMWELEHEDANLSRVAKYLSFIEHARCHVRGFHNFMGYQRDWLDTGGTGDCLGQVVLALADVMTSTLPSGFRMLARELLDDAVPAMREVRSLRAQAYIIQAWYELSCKENSGFTEIEKIAKLSAEHLLDCFNRSQRSDWQWYESRMTYANAVLPHAMFNAAELWPEGSYAAVARSTFDFLDQVTTSGDIFWPIGNGDWYSQGESRSLYDQQPVEVSTMASAAIVAFRFSGHRRYLESFHRASEWFFGKNSLDLTLVDVWSGSCFDGLLPTGINRNEGAESTLAFLWTELLKVQLDIERNQTSPLVSIEV